MPLDSRLSAGLRRHGPASLAAVVAGLIALTAFDAARHQVAAAPAEIARMIALAEPAAALPLPLRRPPPSAPPSAVAPAPYPALEALPAPDATMPPPPAIPVSVERSDDLATLFDRHNYNLDDVKRGGLPVPAIAVMRMPGDLASVPEVDKRKRLFVKALLPMVLQTNEEILADRARLMALRVQMESGEGLTDTDSTWLEALAERYRAPVHHYGELLRRVDMVPPALALAQAITESGWGTSYSARTGNALFGQYHITSATRRTAVGVNVPGSFQMRAFDSVVDSVAGYAANLNTHAAYRKFRQLRAEMRNDGEPLDGYALAGTLLAYSERGQDYIDFLRLIMRTEKLRLLDVARLHRS